METITTGRKPNSRSFRNRMRAPGIRSSLLVLVFGCIFPVAFISAFLIFKFYEYEQTQLISNSISRARAMISVVDRDFANTQAALQTLATSHRLASGDLPGFQARATEVLQNIHAESIMNVDMSGQLLLSTHLPFGGPLPKVNSTPLLQRVLKTGKPEVSDLYIGSITHLPIYAIAVPVMHDGKMTSLLGATVRPSQLAGVLAEQRFPDTWRTAITDSTGTVVARSHSIEQFLGSKVTPALLQQMRIADEGGFKSQTLDGIPVVTIYSRSPTTHWTAVMGVPLDELTAGLRQTLIRLIVATFAALAVGFSLAWFIGGRIARSITAIGKAALALSFGEKLVIPRLQLREANELGQVLLDAESTLHKSKYDAHHDLLTGLANRALFHIVVDQQMALCQRNKTELAILYIDLDGFKAVNDTHGHAMGDQLLRAVSVRLKNAIRDSDIAARIGGDEFAVALIHSDLENAEVFAGALIDIISDVYRIGEADVKISASIGVAGYPVSATDIDMLLKNADKAMYRAKMLGKRRFSIAA